MSLEEKINADIKSAMLAKEKEKLEALRAVKSAVLLAKTEKVGAELSDDVEIKLLQKLVKQRRESALIYVQQNRPELADAETFQADIIEKYLPAQLSPEEVRVVLQEIAAELGAVSVKDMGKVMGAATQKLAGRADGKLISTLVKEILS
ncbi:MAG TPA: GatB/YqeY domain-containing protein [Flavobacteriales bacterium]|nr:GatB/YqeY domain-containing protein [Flavobacteriales bacterium]HPH81014.1 GatB/YqeY domain-containing protein [Flavobacteriales bacterium]